MPTFLPLGMHTAASSRLQMPSSHLKPSAIHKPEEDAHFPTYFICRACSSRHAQSMPSNSTQNIWGSRWSPFLPLAQCLCYYVGNSASTPALPLPPVRRDLNWSFPPLTWVSQPLGYRARLTLTHLTFNYLFKVEQIKQESEKDPHQNIPESGG